jgi:uncharacterized membrane protein
MGLMFAAPSALWWLAAVALVAIGAWRSRTTFSAGQRRLQALVRAAIVALLALALAQPIWSRTASRVTAIYLVDVSHSIGAPALAAAADRIDAINHRLAPDAVRLLAFGTRTGRLADTAALRALASAAPGAAEDSFGRDGSDLERALDEARAELGPADVPRVVLLSDGRETRGDVRAATVKLAAEGIPVFVEPLAVRDLGDAWVDGLETPQVVPAGALVRVTALVGAQRPVPAATVELRLATRVLATETLALEPGLNRIAMDMTLPTPGSALVDVVLASGSDVLAANNQLRREVIVRRRTRALYIEGVAASAGYLQRALEQSGFDVTRRTPGALPEQADGYGAWDVVILSDVPKSAIADAAAEALAVWVERDGGGLFFAGGDSVFGEGPDRAAGGYRRTAIERVLPVTVERKDEPDVALVMVLDKSWSMNGPVMELCKSAAQAAVDVLTDEQMVGLVTFDDRFTLDIHPEVVGEHRDEIRRKIAAVQPGGDTLIYPALEQAYLMLKDVRAGAKHVVLLSDGRSYPDDYEGLVRKMTRANMTVSSIAVGPAADADLLMDIARWGKGRGYTVRDAHEVPQIFVKEAKAAMPSFEEGGAITPVVKSPSFLAHVDLAHLPDLGGRTAMVAKDGATELLATPKGEPLLAFWPIGLGRTAAFASDVKDRWGTAWVKWPGYAPFFSTLLRAVARDRQEPFALDIGAGVVRDATRTIDVRVEARDAQGRYANLQPVALDVRPANGNAMTVPVRQVSPGRYETRITADAAAPLTIAVANAADSDAVRRIVPDPDAEYRFRPPDDPLLRSIAAATGGRYAPALDDFVRPADPDRQTREALWPFCAAAALCFWLLDIWLRRVRIFERSPL